MTVQANAKSSLSIKLMDCAKGDFFVSNFVEADRPMVMEALELSGNADKSVLDEALDMFGKPMSGWFGLYGLIGFCAPSFYLSMNTKQDAGETMNTLEVLGV